MLKPSVYTINFDIKGDERGSLIALENSKEIPFDIKRVYYIFGTKLNVSRGFHAHKKLKQVLICISGSVDIKCELDNSEKLFHLDSPSAGLYIQGLVWREMFNFSPNAVLLVLASEIYDESDYIRSYYDFKKIKM